VVIYVAYNTKLLIILYGNLLKALQGNLDNAIELNEYFVNEVSK